MFANPSCSIRQFRFRSKIKFMGMCCRFLALLCVVKTNNCCLFTAELFFYKVSTKICLQEGRNWNGFFSSAELQLNFGWTKQSLFQFMIFTLLTIFGAKLLLIDNWKYVSALAINTTRLFPNSNWPNTTSKLLNFCENLFLLRIERDRKKSTF